MPFYITSLAVACAIGAGLTLFATKSNAVAAAPTLSGSCGIAMYFTRKGRPITDSDPLDGLGVINFDTQKIDGTLNVYDTNKPKKAMLVPISWDFDVSAGMLAGSALITDRANSGKPSFQVLPVNGSNTFLIQFVDDDTVGVCQKI